MTSINLKLISDALVSFASEVTGKAWIVADQHAPREPSRPYGLLTIHPFTFIGHEDEQPPENLSLEIIAVNQGLKKFTVSGSHIDKVFKNALGKVINSTGNDSIYTVSAVAIVGGDTVLTVDEAIPSIVVDGTIEIGYREIVEQVEFEAAFTIYGDDNPRNVYVPRQLLIDMRAAFRGESYETILYAAGISFRSDSGIVDGTIELEQLREVRAEMSCTFGVVSKFKQNIGIIEQVEMGETYNHLDGSLVGNYVTTIPS